MRKSVGSGDMKAIELLRKLHHLIEVEGVDPDEEIFVTRRVKGDPSSQVGDHDLDRPKV